MKGINWKAMGQLAISLVVIALSVAAVFWLCYFGPVKEAVARLAQVDIYSDHVHHPSGDFIIYLPLVLRNF